MLLCCLLLMGFLGRCLSVRLQDPNRASAPNGLGRVLPFSRLPCFSYRSIFPCRFLAFSHARAHWQLPSEWAELRRESSSLRPVLRSGFPLTARPRPIILMLLP